MKTLVLEDNLAQRWKQVKEFFAYVYPEEDPTERFYLGFKTKTRDMFEVLIAGWLGEERIRTMSCFTNASSCDRIIYSVVNHLNKQWRKHPLEKFTPLITLYLRGLHNFIDHTDVKRACTEP